MAPGRSRLIGHGAIVRRRSAARRRRPPVRPPAGAASSGGPRAGGYRPGMGDGELLLVIGPPAAGKMTVGRAVCERAGFRLFHNHHTIEPLLEIFGFGTPPFVGPQRRVPPPGHRGGGRGRHPPGLHVRLERRRPRGRRRGPPPRRALRRRRAAGRVRRAVRRPGDPAGAQHRREPDRGQALQAGPGLVRGPRARAGRRARDEHRPRPAGAGRRVLAGLAAPAARQLRLSPEEAAERIVAWLAGPRRTGVPRV